MKLARYSAANGSGLGVVVGETLVPLATDPSLPIEMTVLIEQWGELAGGVRALSELGRGTLPLSEVRLLAPVARPSKIFAIGLNYADHVAESGLETPQHQLWFAKAPGTVNGPDGDVEIPIVSTKIDYEAELVAVIGKRGRHISVEDAPRHVFGFCVGNDVSVRDWQTQTPQWTLGKSFDTHGPIGPYITTTEDLGDPHRLAIRSIVNGEVRQSSNTRHLIFNVWDQVAHLSKAMTLEPGDLIYTGTPGGVGLAMKPPQFLAAGDVVRCEIEELGAIENRMVAEAN
jgi:2-keto-4-pentenoate hydratase/2-oxohepta-3-ene-1,7-dioic acid hydratase in catechol pathway